MKKQQKQESKQTSFSSSEVHTGQHGLDCEECAKYVENIMSESDNEPDSFELESDELDAQFEDLEADQMIEEKIEKELKMNNEKSVEKVYETKFDLVEYVREDSWERIHHDFRDDSDNFLLCREAEAEAEANGTCVNYSDVRDSLWSLLSVIMKEARNWKSISNFRCDVQEVLDFIECSYEIFIESDLEDEDFCADWIDTFDVLSVMTHIEYTNKFS